MQPTINESGLQELAASKSGIREGKMDVRDSRAIKAVVGEIGIVDVLFNCAGYVHSGAILDTRERDWDFSFDLNVKSMYQTSEHAALFCPECLSWGAAASSMSSLPWFLA